MSVKHFTFGLVFAGALSVGLAASQATPPQTPPSQPPKTQTKPAPEKATNAATVTGCLEHQSEVAGAAGAQSKSGPTFKLTHIAPDSWKNVAKPTASGAETTSLTEVGVRASGKVDLAPHIDHKVELTGKLVGEKPSTKPGDHMPTFEATSLKMIAPSCQ